MSNEAFRSRRARRCSRPVDRGRSGARRRRGPPLGGGQRLGVSGGETATVCRCNVGCLRGDAPPTSISTAAAAAASSGDEHDAHLGYAEARTVGGPTRLDTVTGAAATWRSMEQGLGALSKAGRVGRSGRRSTVDGLVTRHRGPEAA
jgi:hypothetical protein